MFRLLLFFFMLVLAIQPGRAEGEDDQALAQFRQDQLQQSTGLSEAQARMVVERWTRYDQEQFEKSRQIRQIRQDFKDILLGPGSDEEKNAKVRPLLDQFVALRRQQADLKFRFEDDIRAKLSPAQQVRLIIQVDDMQRRMAEAFRRGIGDRSGTGTGLRHGGPGGGARRGVR